MIGYASASS